jgi:hypothetical protein
MIPLYLKRCKELIHKKRKGKQNERRKDYEKYKILHKSY